MSVDAAISDFDISVPQSAEDFRYFYLQPPGVNEHTHQLGQTVLAEALTESRVRFGIATQPLAWGEVPEAEERPAHVLVGPYNPITDDTFLPRYLARLASSGANVNLAHAFPLSRQDGRDTSAYRALVAEDYFAREDDYLGTHTIYPDNLTDGYRTVSPRAIVDNQIAQTFRLKYAAELVDDDIAWGMLATLQGGITHNVEFFRDLFEGRHLWHRSPTDGAIMLRNGLVPWLVTTVDADKIKLTEDDFAVIHGFDPATNTVEYTGTSVPSMHTPEMLVAAKKLSGDYAVHFHHEATINGDAPEREPWLGKGVLEAGVFDSGEALLQHVDPKSGKGMIISPGEGVFAFGAIEDDFSDFVKKLDIREVKKVPDAHTDH